MQAAAPATLGRCPSPGLASPGSPRAQPLLPPLHDAAQRGDLQAVQQLLAGGADPEGRCPEGLTPLHHAAGNGFCGCVWALRDGGADMAARYGAAAATGGELTALHAFAAHAAQHRTPEAPRQLAALLEAVGAALGDAEGASGPAALARLLGNPSAPSPLALLLLKPHGKGAWQPRSETAALVELLVGAGCRVGAPLSSTQPCTIITEWLRRAASTAGDGDNWRRRITHKPTLAVAATLLASAASAARADAARTRSGPTASPPPRSHTPTPTAAAAAPLPGSPWVGILMDTHDSWGGAASKRAPEDPVARQGAEYLALAVRSGSIELVDAVLKAFPEAARWEGQESWRSPVDLALAYLHPLPPQEYWMGQYVRRALHWCDMAEVLLAAGCQPVALRIRGLEQEQLPLVDAPPATVELPAWAVEPFSFLPLVAAGLPWSEQRHADFPAAFRAAARALLLANHRLSHRGPCGAGGPAAGPAGRLPWLPREVVGHILQAAARPLPSWSLQLRTFTAPSVSSS